MKISVVIPIKLNYIEMHLDEFVSYVTSLGKELQNDDCQIVIADESDKKTYCYMNNRFRQFSNIVHFVPRDRTGDNDKLNGIYAAMDYVKYDRILLIDDHYRITRGTLIKVYEYFDKYDCFKMMPKFDRYSCSVLVDMCGMFVVNILDRRKQYCGHLAFRKEQLMRAGFPNRDALFDEFVMEEMLRKKGYSIGFVKDIALEATQKISVRKFFEQRIRYAYENLAFPFRFTLYALVLPIFLVLLTISPKLAGLYAGGLTIFVLAVAVIGQLIYGATPLPAFTFLFSPIWFWFYPFTTWIAVYKYLTGGVWFGGRKVRKSK
ncbi:MAG: glycosyltransferase family 2 protein [Brevibacillus sp.]|nr:glycosyltransferase family 2 protein [Brevibacillus sp.]